MTFRGSIIFSIGLFFAAALHSNAWAEEVSAELTQLEEGLNSIDRESSPARQRLAIRRVIRDAEKNLAEVNNEPQRWATLEFLFRARKQLVAIDEDSKYRDALLDTCRELNKAPDQFAELRVEADLLLSQVDQAKKRDGSGDRATALRKFVSRYIGTKAGPKALRATMVMALEMGDTRLVNDLRQTIAEHYPSDLEMITFLRDHLGGQVFGVPFVGHFQRSDGKTACYPMDGLGHSSMVIFWSKGDLAALQYIADLAAAQKSGEDRIDGRLEFISVNLDELRDAGESIVRRLGADCPCLHFPGGRENPMYGAYVRVDPLNMRVAPTGQTAMMMRETRAKPETLSGEELEKTLQNIKPSEDFEKQHESFRRTLIRSWSKDDFALHLASLVSGDFLVFAPTGELDPSRPPELRATAKGNEADPLPRNGMSVPEEAMHAIQNCLIAPPRRFHATVPEIRNSYESMRDLCRKTIADHPDAPDLWMVRNRLIIAYLGLWKTDFKLKDFEAAVAESRNAIEADYPKGTDVIPRFCLARQAIRNPETDPGKIIDEFVSSQGGESASGPVYATAILLALDVADQNRYERFREMIISRHTEEPMMWRSSSFLLSRYHDYWMFRVPFTAGWSFGRRMKNEMNKGGVDAAERLLRVELPTTDGKEFRIPEDLKADYTALYIGQPGPWRGNYREDRRPPSPSRNLRQFTSFAVARPDVDLVVALLAEGDVDAVREDLKVRNSDEQIETPILGIAGGMSNPLVHRLGLLNDRGGVALLDKQGRILTTLSGDTLGNIASVLPDTIHQLEEKAVMDLLKKGDEKAAKALIMKITPPYDPQAVDEKGRRLKEPKVALPHLRARTQFYMAVEDWENALADAEAVMQVHLAQAGGMSLRTPELDGSEALRDEIKAKLEKK